MNSFKLSRNLPLSNGISEGWQRRRVSRALKMQKENSKLSGRRGMAVKRHKKEQRPKRK